MCGALATSPPSRVEQRAGEVEPLLDVDRIGGVLQRHAHLLGDRHEEVVEHLEHHRVERGADRGLRARAARRGCSIRWSRGVQLGAPARLDHDGRGRLDDDRRAGDAVARPQVRRARSTAASRSARPLMRAPRGRPSGSRRPASAARSASRGSSGRSSSSTSPCARSPRPMTGSTTSARPSTTKPKRARCSASKCCAIAAPLAGRRPRARCRCRCSAGRRAPRQRYARPARPAARARRGLPRRAPPTARASRGSSGVVERGLDRAARASRATSARPMP